MPSRSFLAVVTLLALALSTRGDEAIRRDGTRISGRLVYSEKGRFTFRVGDRDEPIAGLEVVRFAAKSPPTSAVTLWHQVHLGHDEVVLAEVRKLDATHLHIRPAWIDSLAVPRTAVDRVTHEPGWRPVLFDAFDNGLSRWTKTGEARAEGGRLTFDRGGQTIECVFKPSLGSGRVSVTFPSVATSTRRVHLVLEFMRDTQSAKVRIELIGSGERFVVNAPAKPDLEGKIKRIAGMRHLTAEFDRDRLAIFVDDLVLWSRDAVMGDFRSLRLESTGEGNESATVSCVLVARPTEIAQPKSWADLTVDAVRSPDGDETFGSLSAAGSAGVTLEMKDKKLALAWPEVAEFAFRRGPVTEQPTSGEHVRVRLRTANGVRDILEGVVSSCDDKTLVLVHPMLGELSLPRDRIEEIRLLFFGRLVPVDTTPHHLGSRPAFGFAVPKPEGLRFVKPIALDAKPADGFVIVDAAGVSGTGTPAEVLANGEVIGNLNRYADRAVATVRTYRLPVQATRWRKGENEIEVRARPADGTKVTGIDLRAVRLELPEPR